MDKLKIGIIGAGNIASGYDAPEDDCILTHAKAITRNKDCSLLGFYDMDEAKAKQASEKWGTEYYSSRNELLNEADVVCIAVPDKCHYEILSECIHFGKLKAVITEKPLAASVEEGRQLVKFSEKSSFPILVNYSRRYAGEFNEIKDWIAASAGRLFTGICFYGKGVVHNSSHLVNLLDFLLVDLRVHFVGDAVCDYIEEDPSREYVLASHGAKIYFIPVSADVLTIFGFDLLFEKGRIRYIGDTQVIEYYEVGESEIYAGETNYRQKRIVNVNPNNAMKNVYENLLDVLNKGSHIRCDIKDAYRTLELCETVRQGSVTH